MKAVRHLFRPPRLRLPDYRGKEVHLTSTVLWIRQSVANFGFRLGQRRKRKGKNDELRGADQSGNKVRTVGPKRRTGPARTDRLNGVLLPEKGKSLPSKNSTEYNSEFRKRWENGKDADRLTEDH